MLKRRDEVSVDGSVFAINYNDCQVNHPHLAEKLGGHIQLRCTMSRYPISTHPMLPGQLAVRSRAVEVLADGSTADSPAETSEAAREAFVAHLEVLATNWRTRAGTLEDSGEVVRCAEELEEVLRGAGS